MKIRQIARLCQVCCVANAALALLTACSDDCASSSMPTTPNRW